MLRRDAVRFSRRNMFLHTFSSPSNLLCRLLNESGDIQHALHCRDKEGFTALNRAIMGNHLAVIDLLLEAGAAGVPREGSRNLVPSPGVPSTIKREKKEVIHEAFICLTWVGRR